MRPLGQSHTGGRDTEQRALRKGSWRSLLVISSIVLVANLLTMSAGAVTAAQAATASVATQAAAAPVVMQFSCVEKTTGYMRYSAVGATCTAAQTRVTISISHPILACTVTPLWPVKQITSASQCASSKVLLRLPNLKGPTYFCALKMSSFLRYVTGPEKCYTNEFAVVVPLGDNPPVAVNDHYSTPEDTRLTVPAPGVLANDTDPDAGDTLTAVRVSGPHHGSLTLNPNGSFSYMPAPNYNGADSFTYRAQDPKGVQSTTAATVSLTITPVNDAPTAANLSASTLEDTAKTVSLKGSDIDGDALSFSLVDAPAHGTLGPLGSPTCAGSPTKTCTASVTYTPNPNYNGSDSFTFKVNDGHLDSAKATVSFTVTAVNDAPVANAQSVGTAEDTPVTITLSGSDIEGDHLTFTPVSGPANGTLGSIGTPSCAGTTCTANVTYTPGADYNGPDSFTFKVNDGHLDSSPATVSIAISAVNDPPVVKSQSVTTDEDTSKVVTLWASDIDGDSPSFAIVGTPSHGSLGSIGAPLCVGTTPRICTADVTYTPDANYNGADSFTYKANDGQVDSTAATVSITVNPVNDAPVATSQSVTTDEDTAKTVTLSGSDVDGNTLTFAIVGKPSHGTLGAIGTPSCSAGVCTADVTYTPDANYNGADSFTFKTNDGSLDSNTATVDVTITPVNDAPVATGQSVTTAEDTAKTITLSGSDVDGNTLTFAIVGGPSHGTLGSIGTPSCTGTTCTADVTYTPDANYNGADSFTFKTNDGSLDSNTATVDITVTPVNDPPVAIDDSYIAFGTSTLTVAAPGVLSNDIDVDNPKSDLTAILVSGPSHGSLTLNADGSFSYTATAGATSDSFTYKTSDGAADSNVATVTITVNAPPVANDQSVTTAEDTPLTITLTASDADNDPLTFSTVGTPAHGTLGAVGTPDCSAVNTCTATVQYTPDANYNGADSFTFKTNDTHSDSNTATVSITVTPVNDPPVATSQSVTTDEDTAKTVTLSGSDVDGNALTFAIVGSPLHGTLGPIGTPSCTGTTCTADVTYTPAANYNGSDSFTFKVNDGTVDSLSAGTVSITVNPVNDPPVAVNDSYKASGTATLTVAAPGVLANDTDIDSPTLTAVLVSGPSHGSLTLNADGSFSYTATAGATSDSFTYKANDGQADSNVATVSIAINAPPVANDQSVTTNEDTAKTITLTASDADDDPLTFSTVGVPAHGTLGTIGTPDCSAVNTCTATVTYTPAANYNGVDSFTFKVNDGHTDSPAGTVSITVNPVNDPPVATSQSVTTDEDTAKTVTLSGSDVDGNALTFAIVGGPLHGTLGPIGTPSCTGTTCTADVTYTPAANYNGSDSFTFKVNDGTVDSLSAGTVSITVNPVNDPPVSSGQSVSTNEDTAKSITLSATDVDGDTLAFSIVAQPANGTLGPIGTPSCAGTTCTATVTYTPAANYNGSDSFTFKTNDGTVDSNTAAVTITVIPVNDPPVLANLESAALGFTEGDSATAITSTLTVSDVDNTTLTGGTVSISAGYQSGQDVLALPSQPNITGSFNAATGVLTLSGTATLAEYQTALRAVTYANGSQNPSTTARSITFQVNDGQAANNLSTPVSRQLTVTAVNDPPVNTVPAAQTVNEDTVLTFSSATGNAISTSDVDAGSAAIQVSVSVLHGTLTPASGSGATIGGSGTGSLTITGTLTQANAALNGLKYQGTQDYNSTRGAETLTVVTNDQGNTGTGGALTATDTVGITVNAVNDAPTAQAKSFTVQANMKISLSGLLSGATDPDTGDGGYTASFTVNDVVLDACPGGVISNLNASAGTFDFEPPAGSTAACTLKYRVTDSGNPAPGLTSAYAQITITINGPVIWFVDATNGSDSNTGTLSKPFKTLAAADAVDAANQHIFLYGSATSYTGGLTLNSGETLQGQSASNAASFDALYGITPPAGTIARPTLGGTVPVITSSGKGVILGSGNTLNSLKFSGTADNAVSSVNNSNVSNNVGTLTLRAIEVANGSSAGAGIVLTGGGTVTSAGTNVLTTGSGTALNVSNTTIGAGGLTFRSISSNGATSGIILNTTGSSGGLTVSGTGSAGTGGTIQNTTGHGISLTNTTSSIFQFMNITNSGLNGVRGSGVNGFTLDHSTLSDTAGDVTKDDGVGLSNTSGAVSITNDSITGSRHQGITIDNFNTNMASLTIASSTVSGTPGGDGVLIQMRGTSNMTTGTIGGATAALGNTFSNNSATGLQVNNADTGNIAALTIQNNTVSGNNAGMDLDLSQSSSMTVTVVGNTYTNQHSTALNLVQSTSSTAGTLTASLKNNTIGTAGVLDSGSAIGNGIALRNGGVNISLNIDSNIIREVPNGRGIDIEAQAYTVNANVKVKITNNTIVRPTGTNQNIGCGANVPCPSASIFVLSDNNNVGGFDHVCTVVSGNSAYDPTSWAAGGEAAYYFARRTTTSNTLQLEGNTAQTPQQNVLGNNSVTNSASAPFVDEGAPSMPTVVVAAGTCGSFPS